MRRGALAAGLLVLAGGTPADAQPYPITPLVLEGDVVAGVGTVTTINNLAVNDNGDWIVEADTDFANTDADSVLLRNGALLLREGDALPAPAGATLNSFDSVGINVHGDSGWNFFLTGPPGDQDSGLFFNTTLVIQEGNTTSAPGFSPGTRYIGFFEAHLNDANELLVVASMDDPAIASSVDRAILRLELDNAGALLAENLLAKESDVLPGQLNPVADFGTGPHQSAINESGQILFFADLDGPTATDGAIYLDATLLAQEGNPSPLAGRSYELLSGRGLDLNNAGAAAFKANLDGSTTDDEVLVRDGQVFAQELDPLPGTAFLVTSFGTSSGPVRLDDHGNLLWFADWNDPDTDEDTGLLLNALLLVQEGVTLVGGQPMDIVASGTDAFAMSDNGRYVVFEGTLLGGINGAFLIEITPPPTVPDGNLVPGSPMVAGKSGSDVAVTWDVATCTADEYLLLYGALADVADLTYSGAACGLGTTGSATFGPPAGSVFWTIVAADASNVEGSHGFDSAGAQRDASSSGFCAVPAQVKGDSCP